MKTFYFTVRGDHITKKEDYVFIEGNKGSYEAVFDFGEEWDEMAKVCIVENGEDVHKEPIFGNSCLLPEVCGSSARIGVIGVDSLDGAELVTRISTNMLGIGIQDGAASREVTAELNTAAAVWEKYLSDMENSRKAAEAAKEVAEEAAENAKNSKNTALTAEGNAKTYAENAKTSAGEAKTAAEEAAESNEEAQSAAKGAESARGEAVKAAENLDAAVKSAKKDAEAAALSANNASESANSAEGSAQVAEESKTEMQQLTKRAETAADNAETAEQNSAVSEAAARQALSDLLRMINSGDLVLATDGKLPLSSIPATATQEIYAITSEAELTTLTAQRGDLAELIENVNGEQTITKTWQCLGDTSVRENWVVWGTSYAVQSGNASNAENALNANMINNHRLVEMTEEEFAVAVKDENTYYLVY